MSGASFVRTRIDAPLTGGGSTTGRYREVENYGSLLALANGRMG